MCLHTHVQVGTLYLSRILQAIRFTNFSVREMVIEHEVSVKDYNIIKKGLKNVLDFFAYF